MEIINQPFKNQLGTLLKNDFRDQWETFYFFTAFAKNSGVLRLQEDILKLKERGTKVIGYVGVDLFGTSYEALLNLYRICDELYIIHSEKTTNTFHSKIYCLIKEDGTGKVYVGSNNMTGGGLWTNYETCICERFESIQEIIEIKDLVQLYEDNNYECSLKVTNKEIIESLLTNKYIIKESNIRLQKKNDYDSGEVKHDKLFGNQKGVEIPRIKSMENNDSFTVLTSGKKLAEDSTNRIAENDFAIEQIWFETKKMTGGSRNILDLSKMAKIILGSCKDTKYYVDESTMLGGVAFFDLDPENIMEEKNIIINYEGNDYCFGTIKYPTSGVNPNGSWRLQLKGNRDLDNKALTQVTDFTSKIICFEKIRSDYYVMTVEDDTKISEYIDKSFVVCHNGRSDNSKRFGLF